MREGLLDGTAHVTVACAFPTKAEIVAGADGVDKDAARNTLSLFSMRIFPLLDSDIPAQIDDTAFTDGNPMSNGYVNSEKFAPLSIE
jgi:hypothetical protein